MRNVQKYSKLIVALVGVAYALIKMMDIELPITETALNELVISILIAFGVWGVPNKQPEQTPE